MGNARQVLSLVRLPIPPHRLGVFTVKNSRSEQICLYPARVNCRPLAPKASALTGLRYAPIGLGSIADCMSHIPRLQQQF